MLRFILASLDVTDNHRDYVDGLQVFAEMERAAPIAFAPTAWFSRRSKLTGTGCAMSAGGASMTRCLSVCVKLGASCGCLAT